MDIYAKLRVVLERWHDNGNIYGLLRMKLVRDKTGKLYWIHSQASWSRSTALWEENTWGNIPMISRIFSREDTLSKVLYEEDDLC